jgi:hypothetical protein
MLFREIDVWNKLNGLSVNKSFGPDLIHPKVLYELKNTIVGPLTALFNKYISINPFVHFVLTLYGYTREISCAFHNAARL